MRILKRNLAFMLAMIMALSLTAFAGYEDYSDVEELTYVEAVDVLTELGIVEGSDGALLPTGNLTRAQAAKLIAYTMLGKKAADALQAEVAPFVDVPAYHWAAGYVEYCADQGIVGGMGDGTFAPEANVTGSQFAKMLLCAVGYGEKGEFTGLSWDSTVNAQGTKLGIFDGNEENVVFANAVTREEAFLYTFNALTKVMEVTYSADADEYYAGTVFNSIKGFDFDETLGAKLYDLSTKTATDVFGRDSYNWYKGSKKIAGMYHEAPKAVYTASVKSSVMFNDLDLDETTYATVIKNGTKLTAKYQIQKNLTKSAFTTGEKLGAGNGVLVEAYVDADMDVTLIVIDTYLAKVTNIRNDAVTLNIWNNNDGTATTKVIETALEVEEGDYVLVTMTDKDDEVQTIVMAEKVNGELNERGTDSKYTILDEVKYSHSKHLDQKATDTVYKVKFDVEMTMILDEYGYMIGLMPVKEAAKLDGYVLVTDSEVEVGGLASSDKALVEVLHLDGTGYEVLNLQTKRDKDADGVRTTYYKNVNGKWAPITKDNDGKDVIPYGFYGYYMTEDGAIVLMNLGTEDRKEAQILSMTTTAAHNGVNADAVIKANVAGVEGQEFKFGNLTTKNGAALDLVLDANTVLNMVTSKDVETIEGYKNIKIDEQDVDALVIYNGRTVETIYVVDGSLYNKNNYVYYTGTEIAERAGKYYITLYVDGVATTYKYHTDEEPAKGIYKLEVEDNTATLTAYGYESVHKALVEKETALNFDAKNIKSGAVTKLMTYADGVKIFDLTDDGAALDAVEVDDEIMYVVNEEGKGVVVTHIWVLKHYSKASADEDKVPGEVTVAADKAEDMLTLTVDGMEVGDKVKVVVFNYANEVMNELKSYSYDINALLADGTWSWSFGTADTTSITDGLYFQVQVNGGVVKTVGAYSFQ